MRIANTKMNKKTSRIKGHTTGGTIKRAHNVGKTYKRKMRGR